MKRTAASAILSCLISCVILLPANAHEGAGRAGLKELESLEIETEFYAGKGGYLHGGLGAVGKLNERQGVGIVGHFVREDSKGEIFPSLGAEFIQQLDNHTNMEVFTFGYFPVEDQYAWALGLRGSRQIECNDKLTITPFFGPTFARVQAIDEATEDPTMIGHFMLLGGLTVHSGPVDMTIFASHSFFSRDPRNLETHVDLEEMTHFATYENNDGFAQDTVGTEISIPIHERITLTGRYALILYKDETRHSISFTPEFGLNSQTTFFTGFQLLRGGGADNDLFVAGVSFAF